MNQKNSIIIGIDWADAKHDFHLIEPSGEIQADDFEQSPNAIAEQLQLWRKDFPGATFLIAIEASKGALINALIDHEDIVIYPVNPAALSFHRKSYAHGGGKNDPLDAKRLAGFLKQRLPELRPLRRDQPITRELGTLSEDRRRTVDARADLANELTALLKQYFPAVLSFKAAKPYATFLLSFLIEYPTLQAAQAAGETKLRSYFHGLGMKRKAAEFAKMIVDAMPLTVDEVTLRSSQRRAVMLAEQLKILNKHIRKYEASIKELLPKHPAYAIAKSLPGPADNTQARLIAAMGDDHNRYSSAQSLQCASGIAPLTEQSGKRKFAVARWAYTKFLRQTFHEMAGLSINKSKWAKAYYNQQIAKGKSANTAKRALAYKWQRIIYRCWQSGQPYDEERYIARLKATNAPLYQLL
ncbi:Transposase [Novipirellula aureliae]|uniref:Transposase n=1 Tax=Novipirellula aureliae TaxID=2527966 RepID=A0A5C6DK01_9BACT|nr:IS110 family transposase [Novipirellula aureliae]TWU35189.1 Transposase [Novipirellula aureliae]